MKASLVVSSDVRSSFLIDDFGFDEGGKMLINFKSFEGPKEGEVVIVWSDHAHAALQSDVCAIDQNTIKNTRVFSVLEDSKIVDRNITFTETANKRSLDKLPLGYYYLFYRNCAANRQKTSFELSVEQYNIDQGKNQTFKNYLPVGDKPLPIMYLIFSVTWVLVTFFWLYALFKKESKPNLVHVLMTIFVFLLALSLIFETAMIYFMQNEGHRGGWSIPYYMFLTTKGILFFVLLALIGSGLSFVKPYLTEREKRLLLVVVPLQVLDNIALVIVKQMGKGNMDWETWLTIFRFFDLVCCCVVLVPIIWSIKSLKDAAQIDGKAAINLRKLRLFRTFYIIVVSYMYFRVMVLYLLDISLYYTLTWLSPFFDEFVSLVFFVCVGYYFRPTSQNVYLSLDAEEHAEEAALNRVQIKEIQDEVDLELLEKERIEGL